MHITRNTSQTATGPSEWFTGTVYIDPVAVPLHGSCINGSNVHFTPGAGPAWHTHPHGQAVYVTEGIARVQRRNGQVEEVRPGDRGFFEPGQDHWHGAAPTRFSLVQVDEQGDAATWGAHVTDEESGATPADH